MQNINVPVSCCCVLELALGRASYESFQEEKGKKGRGNVTLVKDKFSLAVQADSVA